MIKKNFKLGPNTIRTLSLVLFLSVFFISGYSQSRNDSDEYGYLKGEVIYPSEVIPIQKVCAVNVSDSLVKYCTESDGDNKYSLKVPPGVYYVYAWAITDTAYDPETPGNRGYYTDAVLCGFTVDCGEPCGDRSVLLKVRVEAGKTINNIDPTDWYWNEILIIKWDKIVTIRR